MNSIPQLVQNQNTFFQTGQSREIAYRKAALLRFRESIKKHNQEIIDALYADFKKPAFETVATELSIVHKELNLAIKEIWRWQMPKKVRPSLLNFPSSAKIMYEPYGTALVIAPWNYPLLLALGPIIGAITAGNTVVLKPSELTPRTSDLIAKIVSDSFDPNHVSVVQGAVEVAQELLKQRWDYIFFTGSVPVGKIVYQAAAKYLTPVTLELGGKTPCVVDDSANLKQAAKRIVWGKFVNGGQTCIAPDYIVVHNSKEKELLDALKKEIIKAYGKNPKVSPDFARIINAKNFDRLQEMLKGATVHTGGELDRQDLYIAPTVLQNVTTNDAIMKEEIFGPILPVLAYGTQEDIERILHSNEKPLSAYVFSRKRSFKKWFTNNFSYGGGVVNDTLVHFINDHMGFGGVGHSGVGSYHGKQSFLTFSHSKSIVSRSTHIDVPLRYAPYKNKLGLLIKILKWL